MRNVILIVSAIAVLTGGWLLFGRGTDTTPAVGTIEVQPTTNTEEAAPAVSDAASKPAASEAVVAVEESTGEEDAEPASEAHDLTLASSGGAKQQANSGKFKKGNQYIELTPTQPTVTGTDKIEVVEVFWYGCSHCFAFDPKINRWEETAPADVEFVRLPAIWNDTLKLHARAFYAAEILAKSGALADPDGFHDAFFREIHVERKPMNGERSIKAFFDRFGISGEDYDKTAQSFEVDQKLRTADDLMRRYGITSVPMVVVNGRYVSRSAKRGEPGGLTSPDEYIQLIDQLVESER